jgi:hypothetical protein
MNGRTTVPVMVFGRRSVERAEPLCCRRPKTITKSDIELNRV